MVRRRVATLLVLTVASTLVAASWVMAGAPGSPPVQRLAERWSGPGHAHADGGTTVRMAQDLFLPAELRVRVGERVTWVNEDGYAHTVTADDHEGFDSGLLQEGERWSRVFGTPGTYTYHCHPHAWQRDDGSWRGMVAVVVVTA